MEAEIILEAKNITKTFPGVVALDDVSLVLKKGEILSLLGENGAGKSTLMKILSGSFSAYDGEIILDGEKIEATSPYEMLHKGIAVVYQELSYIEDLSIAENIFIDNLPLTKTCSIDYKKLRMDTEILLKKVGLNMDPFTDISQLSVAEKQMIEIVKILSKDNKVLIMDEPTSSLNETEVDTLFELLRNLAEKGKSIIYITHKMREIFELSDRVQVLRDGKHIGIKNIEETNVDELVSMMVGRSIENMYPKEEIERGEVLLEVKDLCGRGINNVSFNIKAGEIVGMFGLLGSGRTEITECIFGKRHKTDGVIKIEDKKVNIKNPTDAIKNGIAYLPRERKSDGLLMVEDVKKNMTLVYLEKLQKLLKLNLKEEKKKVEYWVDRLRIKTPSINTPIKTLSGGNQQKVVIGKWLMNNPKILILNEPTRGIDVGAKVEIYKLIEELCKSGMAILLISSECPEIMGISDRILVVSNGEILGELNRDEFCQEKMMHLAIGGC